MHDNDHVSEIDGLRAMAVVAVIVYHLHRSYLPFGYLGVDIFFAISGYVISKSILERLDSGDFTVNGFFMRRAKRLLPALAVVTTASIGIAALVMPNNGPLFAGAAAFIGVSNIALWFSGHDYFAEVAELNPLTHTWSLGVEEQFYLLFPLCLLLLNRRPKATIWALGIAAATSLASYVSLWDNHRATVFYLSPFRLWELVGGAFVYVAHRSSRCPLRAAHQRLIKCGLLVLLLVVLFSIKLQERIATVICVFSSCGVLYLAGLESARILLLCNRVSVYIGRVSYSLYLWHWPVAVFAKLLLPPAWVTFVYVVLTAGLSLFSYYLIELPFRHRAWSWFQERFIVAYSWYGAIAVAIVVGFWLSLPALYLGPASMRERQFLINSGCHLPVGDGLRTCLHADVQGRMTIWLVGDSHAGNFLMSLRSAAAKLGVGFQFLTGRSLFESLTEKCAGSLCAEGSYGELASRLALVSQPGDIVVMSFARDRVTGNAATIDSLSRNLASFVHVLRLSHLRVVLVEDIPKVCAGSSFYFQSAFWREVCSTTASASRLQRSALSNIYNELNQQPDVAVLDPHDYLCEPGSDGQLRCSNWLGNELLYVDASPHLTQWASYALTTFFVDGLTPIVTTKAQGIGRSAVTAGQAGQVP